MISLIVAYAKNRVIGKDNDIPWHIPGEQVRFKEITMGHPMIMGRNTFESIYNRRKGPLPGRRNIVVSRSLERVPDGFELARSLEEALKIARPAEEEVFIIGGEQLFKECIDGGQADRLYASEIKAGIEGDRFFPPLPQGEFRELKRTPVEATIPYDFVIYERIGK